MNVKEFVGVDSYLRNSDGTELSHYEFCMKVIEKLGGLDAIIPFIPFTFAEIKEALQSDEHLNNLSMSKWDMASGFKCQGWDVNFIGGGIVNLYKRHGINVFSNSDGVSILKEAARMWVENMVEEEKTNEKAK